jgi:hypothetical protein
LGARLIWHNTRIVLFRSLKRPGSFVPRQILIPKIIDPFRFGLLPTLPSPTLLAEPAELNELFGKEADRLIQELFEAPDWHSRFVTLAAYAKLVEIVEEGALMRQETGLARTANRSRRSRCRLSAKLCLVESSKNAAGRQQLIVPPLFHDSLLGHHNNPVGIFGRGQAVRDD